MADTFVNITFVADELLTSTKMNQLAANQAGFHSGSALGDGIIVSRHVADSNITGSKIASYRTSKSDLAVTSEVTTDRIERGWNYVVGVNNVFIPAQTFNFKTPFANAPDIYITPLGYKSSPPTSRSDFLAWEQVQMTAMPKIVGGQATGFSLITGAANANIPTGRCLGFSWLAIGS